MNGPLVKLNLYNLIQFKHLRTRKPDVRLEDRREKENQAFKMIHSLKGDEPVSVVPPQEQRQMNVMSMYGSTHKHM